MRTLGAALLSLFAALSIAAAPGFAEPPSKPGEVILKFRAGTPTSVQDSILADLQASTIRRFSRIHAEHDHLGSISTDEAIRRYKNHPSVEVIEPNYILSASRTPNDPLFDQLWGLNNTGQTGGLAGADIDALHAWDIQTGSSSVVVGIIDTGVDMTHPDLAANIYTNPGEIAGNGIDDDGNGFIDDVHGWDFVNHDNNPSDDYGHGTHVAGTIGAVGNNALGVAGVAWSVRIMPIKFLDSSGYGTTADAISCVEYATLMGVTLTSNSWGGGGYSEALRLAIQDAGNAGILFVAAAGNAGMNTDFSPNYPSGYDLPNIISVAATDDDDLLASFSNYGATSVDLGAPGVNVLSSVPGGGYATKSGTSMATPHVSGILALIKSEYPLMNMTALKSRLLGTVDLVPSLAGKTVTGGRANAFRALERPDSLAPAAVLDLHLVETWSGGLRVEWTATGDDGLSGRASGYELRYATFPLTAESFASGIPAPAPEPSPAGTLESASITGLGFSTTYHVALRVVDEAGNPSPLSNVIVGTTLGQPALAFAPDSVTASLFTGGTALRTLTLTNAGEGTLDFNVAESQSAATVALRAFTPLARGQADPRVGDPVLLGAGGPDHFGYRWTDSDQPGGPAFLWVDISGVGTRIPMSTLDDNFGPIPIGFAFPFYGGSFTNVHACTHGWVSFTNSTVQYTNQPLPNVGAPENLLAVFWEDLDFTGAERAYYYNDGTRFVLEYLNVPRTAGGATYTFEVLLYPSGEIVYQYLTMEGVRNGGTIGIQNGARDDGLTIDFNADYVHDGLAIRIAAQPDWFAVTPSSGRVSASQSLDLQVAIDAADLLGGTYPGTIILSTNDPARRVTTVPVRLSVTGVADIDLSRTALDFGPLFVGATRVDSIVVQNRGTDVLHVSSVSASPGDFTATPVSFTVSPQQRRTIFVTFAPSAAVPIAGAMTLLSDDPDEPSLTVPLSGAGLVPPDIAVSPESVSVALFTGESTTRSAEVRNEGGSDLVFEIGYGQGSSGRPEPAPTPLSSPVSDFLASYQRNAAGNAEPFVAASPSPRPGTLPTGEGIERALADSIPIFHDDMEHGPNGWTHSAVVGTVDLWGTSTARHASGLTSWRVQQHESQGSDALRSPSIDLRLYRDALLTFHQWYDYDDCGGDPSFEPDGGIVEVSADGGATWTTVAPVGGYPYVLDDICGNPIADQAAYSHNGGVGATFVPAVFDLSAFAGQVIRLRFRAGWDCGNCGPNEGWYVDDVAVYSTRPRVVVAEPGRGTVPPGGSLGLALQFSAESLFGGDYRTDVLVQSNDPDENPAVIATTVHVTGAPDIAWDPPALDFGVRFIGTARTDTLAVFNAGTDVLHVTGIELDRAEYDVETAPFTLEPGGRRDLHATFRPAAAGPVAAILTLRSDDPDEPAASVPIQGEGVVAPNAVLEPASVAATVETGQTATRTLTLRNDGGSDLTFQAHGSAVESTSPPGDPVSPPDSLSAPTSNAGTPPAPPAVQAVYAGANLRFGVTSYGEIVPFQHPVGTEHLQVGGTVSGYTVAYQVGAADHVAYAVVYQISGLSPESYREIENSPARVVVEVSVRTFDGALRILRRITFERSARAVRVESRLENLTGTSLGAVVFKESADWDVDGQFYDDWDYDRGRNLVYAKRTHVAGIASAETPGQMDLYGWNDLFGRATTVDFPAGPVLNFDGIALLHFDVGTLAALDARTIVVAYGAADNLEQLRSDMADALRAVSWLTVTPASGTVHPGEALELTVGFDPERRSSGDYAGRVVVDSNDPFHPSREASAIMTVVGRPLFAVRPPSLDFGSVFVGASAIDSVYVRNDGVDPLLVSGVTPGDPSYSAAPVSFAVAPGDSQLVLVGFHPLSPGDKTSALAFVHNAAGSPASVEVRGTGLVPPDLALDPPSFSIAAETGKVESRTLTVRNEGGSELVFTASTNHVAAAGSPGDPVTPPDSLLRPTRNRTEPSASPPAVSATYQGTYLRFGISAYGEIMPYQYPIGVEHLQNGVYISGFTLAYMAGGVDHLATTINQDHFNVIPETYEELENSPSWVIVLVTVRTGDGMLRIRRRFEFDRSRRAVRVTSSIENATAAPITDLVFKEIADWDADGEFENTWNYDPANSMVYASKTHFVAIGSATPPTLMDLYGWYDYYTRATYVEIPAGPVLIDGLALLHFELGNLGASQTTEVATAYAAGDDLAQLRESMSLAVGSPSWLSVAPTSGRVAPGGALDLEVRFDPERRESGEYRGEVRIESNDPDESLARVPATMVVTARPVIAVRPGALDFGGVFVGASAARSAWIRNDGVAILHVSSIGVSDPSYTFVPTTLAVAPSDSQQITVTFAPTSPGDHAASLALAHDAAGSPTAVGLSGTGVVPPKIVFQPERVEAAVRPARSGTAMVNVRNDGGADLTFTIAKPPPFPSSVEIMSYRELRKGEVDSRLAILGTGGPDRFGHYWLDSDQPGGPAYEWVDVRGIGTHVPFASVTDDATLGPFPIGFDFPYFGGVFHQFRICSNGWISFTNGLAAFSNQPLPNAGAAVPENLIAALWDDLLLDASAGSSVDIWGDTERMIVQYTNALPLGVYGAAPHTFQIVLKRNGEIRLQYQSVGTLLSGATVGFQNGARDDGLTVSFNGAYLHSNMAVRIVKPEPWVTVTPMTGTVPVGGVLPLTLTFDPGDLTDGDHEANLDVSSNDIAHPSVSIPILLHVGETPAADADFDPNTLSKASNGRYVMMHTELPPGVDPWKVVLGTVRFQDALSPAQDALAVGDWNGNGIPDLEFRFHRDQVEEILNEGDKVPVLLTGQVGTQTWFAARDSIRVIRPRVLTPNGREVLIPGATYNVSWSNPGAWVAKDAGLYYSTDLDSSWTLIADHVVGTSYAWTVPAVSAPSARLRVYLFDAQGVMGYDASDEPFAIVASPTGVTVEEAAPPAAFALRQNKPNPFNPSTVIGFDLPAASRVRIDIFQASGRLVRTLVNEPLPAGRFRAPWDGRDDRGRALPSGVYLYRLAAGKHVEARRMLLLK